MVHMRLCITMSHLCGQAFGAAVINEQRLEILYVSQTAGGASALGKRMEEGSPQRPQKLVSYPAELPDTSPRTQGDEVRSPAPSPVLGITANASRLITWPGARL